MRPSRGMGAIAPTKQPKPQRKARRDNTDFTEYADGGWIKGAIKNPGALRKSLGVKSGEKIPQKQLSAAAKKPGVLGKRARLAQTLKKLR